MGVGVGREARQAMGLGSKLGPAPRQRPWQELLLCASSAAVLAPGAQELLRQKCVLSHSQLSIEGGLYGCKTTTKEAIKERVQWRWSGTGRKAGHVPQHLWPSG